MNRTTPARNQRNREFSDSGSSRLKVLYKHDPARTTVQTDETKGSLSNPKRERGRALHWVRN